MITKNRLKFIENKAKKLQKENSTTSPELIAFYLDIKILYRAYKKQLGAFTIINKIPFIFINENLSYEEKQNVIAHEIGHYILHKKLIKDLFLLRDFGLFSKRENEMEKEANIFAANLMIDKKIFDQLIKENKNNKEIAHYLKVNIELVNLISK